MDIVSVQARRAGASEHSKATCLFYSVVYMQVAEHSTHTQVGYWQTSLGHVAIIYIISSV
jgi:hypothetical protein